MQVSNLINYEEGGWGEFFKKEDKILQEFKKSEFTFLNVLLNMLQTYNFDYEN